MSCMSICLRLTTSVSEHQLAHRVSCPHADVAMGELVTGLSTALGSVTHLHLDLTWRKLDPAHATEQSQQTYAQLAAALPSLQHLTLTDTRCKFGLVEFGSRCTHLSQLPVKACTTDVALYGEMECLPKLTHLTVSGEAELMLTVGEECVMSIMKCLSNQQLHLQVLDLQCASSPSYRALQQGPFMLSAEVWNKLPTTLIDLRCTGIVDVLPSLLKGGAFASRLRCLTLRSAPSETLLSLLQVTTRLERLVILTPDLASSSTSLIPIQTALASASSEGVVRFQDHLQRGFQIVCPWLSLRGPPTDIRRILTWLHPQPGVTSVVGDEIDDVELDKAVCELAECAFPNLRNFYVSDRYVHEEVESEEVESEEQEDDEGAYQWDEDDEGYFKE